MSAPAVTFTPTPAPLLSRFEAIDQFRGLAILLMVLVNYLGGVQIAPAWLKHAPDVGLTLADLVAPFFILAIGLTYGLSARRRLARDGWYRTAVHFFTRWMAIAGIGFFIGAGEIIIGVQQTGINWGVLQASWAITSTVPWHVSQERALRSPRPYSRSWSARRRPGAP